MYFSRSLVCIFSALLFWQKSSTAEQIICPVTNVYVVPKNGSHGVFLNGTVRVAYHRHELAIYKYEPTNLANFLLSTAVWFDGEAWDDYKNMSKNPSVWVILEGMGSLEENEDDTYSLKNCRLDFKKNVKSSSLPEDVVNAILNVGHNCAYSQLCPSFGHTQDYDFIRSLLEDHNFGENSALFASQTEKYPLLLEPSAESKDSSGLQITLNFFADFWLASMVKQVSEVGEGSMIMPDSEFPIPGPQFLTGGHFHIANGSISDLRKFKRLRNVNLSRVGLEFVLDADYFLNSATIHYNDYSFKVGLATATGELDVVVSGLIFHVRASLNYNQYPCRISITKIKAETGAVDFQLEKGSLFHKTFNKLSSPIIKVYSRHLVEFVEARLESVLNEPLERFDCEKFRP